MADFDLDLDEFERELAEGKYEGLIPAKVVKPKTKLQLKEQAKKKQAIVKVLEQVPVKPVELPAPTAVVFYYKQFNCLSCNQPTELLAQRLVRFELGKQNYLKPESEISDNVDTLLKGGIKVYKMVAKEKVIACSFCCDRKLYEELPTELFTTQRG